MINNLLVDANNPPKVPQLSASEARLEAAQENIYSFFLLLMRQKTSEQALMAFKNLFFEYRFHKNNFQVMQELHKILVSKRKYLFFATLKRCCYILVNNWEISRHHAYTRELITSFERLQQDTSPSRLSRRLRSWMFDFYRSQDYQELELYITRHEKSKENHWSQRYISYFLIAEATDSSSSPEQQEAARTVSQYLKQQFKFDFAMFTARQKAEKTEQEILKNPTALGDEAITIIKQLIAKQGLFDYSNFANIFLQQVQNEAYFYFKACLFNYLIYPNQKLPINANIEKQFLEKLESLYIEHEDKPLNESLIIRTCNRLIEKLTTEDGKSPSALFLSLILQTNAFDYVVFLLKIVLISPNSRTFLEARMAVLIKYYVKNAEEDCQWIVNFFEIFNIAMSIHADKDVRYSLVRIKETAKASSQNPWDIYRIFSQESQIKANALSTTELLADLA